MDPLTIGSITSGLSLIIKAIEFSTRYAIVKHTVEQLLINVSLADQAITTAQRLIRLKPYLDKEHLLKDALNSINHTKQVLTLLQQTIEECRKDIEVTKTVRFGSRVKWVVYKEQEFLGRLATLSNALDCLNRDIIRMETVPAPQLPTYKDIMKEEGQVGDRAPSLRAPSLRAPSLRAPNRRGGITDQTGWDFVDGRGEAEENKDVSDCTPTYTVVDTPDTVPGSYGWQERNYSAVDKYPSNENRYLMPREATTRHKRRSDLI